MERLTIGSILLVLCLAGCISEYTEVPKVNQEQIVPSYTEFYVEVYRGQIEAGLLIAYTSHKPAVLIKSIGSTSIFTSSFSLSDPAIATDSPEAFKHRQVTTELIKIEEGLLDNISTALDQLEDEDFKSVVNHGDFRNGIAIKLTVIDRDNTTKEVTLVNTATNNQRRFLSQIFDVVMKTTKYNKKHLPLYLNEKN